MSKPLNALGLMSGTSLDGIDVAFLETDGESVTRRGLSLTVPYTEAQRNLLKAALADATELTERTARPGTLRQAERESTLWHIAAVQHFCEVTGVNLSNIDVIGYHGQTVIHRPEMGLTVQLGLGGDMATALQTPVVFDMRAHDMQNGGQGAPLVPVYHRALASAVEERPVAILNIGGVANVTWIGRDGALLAFDTGPGNALIDDWMKTRANTARDEGGRHALAGKADESTVAHFMGDSYFESPLPKSLDRNAFSHISLDGMRTEDGAATLVAVTARSIGVSTNLMPEKPALWLVCGGGRHNNAIMQALQEILGAVEAAEHLGLDGDAIEAEAWAFLAVRSLRGLPLTYPSTTGVRLPVTGGVLVRP